MSELETSISNLKVEETPAPAETAAPIEGAAPETKKGQHIDPWTVESDGQIDYDKLIDHFGCQRISQELLDKFERITKRKPHHFLRRGIFFSHRDLDRILDCYEAGQKIYLYTGRGPSSLSLHLGHLIPFMFTKWLQEVFDCVLVIQLTDDEKFLFKNNLTIQDCQNMAYENLKDILALGFPVDKTFVFCNTEYISHLYPTALEIMKSVTYNQARAIFGFTGSDNIGKSFFPALEAAPAFPTSFPQIFPLNTDPKKKDKKKKNVPYYPCLVPCAIDQDAFFRMTRDVAPKLGMPKPSLIHSVFFPPLQGIGGKMSASNETSAVYLTDTPKQIATKIKKHAFSGGQETLELQRELGANVAVDVSCEWLRFFYEDDEDLDRIFKDYGSGKLLTGEVKEILIKLLQDMVSEHQKNRANITDEVVRQFTAIRPLQL